MSTDIKECPFCGSTADVQNDFGVDYWVQCSNLHCGSVDGTIYGSPAPAIEHWNRRPAQAPSAPVAPDEREFVEAIANNFNSHDCENDEVICRGCSAPELWIEATRSDVITHRPECIVLRARAALSVKAEPEIQKSLLREPISPSNPLPPGCFCKPGRCAAPVIMGRQTPCRDPAKRAAAPTPPTTGEA